MTNDRLIFEILKQMARYPTRTNIPYIAGYTEDQVRRCLMECAERNFITAYINGGEITNVQLSDLGIDHLEQIRGLYEG